MNITYSIFLRPFVLCFFILSINTHAQFHEIGLFLGGSNYIGDIGSDQYVKPSAPAFGLLYKWNITERYSLRSGISISKLTEKETNNRDLSRFNRSYSFENEIQEATVGVEFNFKEFNLHDSDFNFTPYLFYGLSYFRYDQYFITPNGPGGNPVNTNFGKDQEFAVPFILGLKLNPNPFIILGFEMGARFTLTDNLDGSNPGNQYLNQVDLKFGNVENNDWYLFMGFTISFTFGDLPCYCKE